MSGPERRDRQRRDRQPATVEKGRKLLPVRDAAALLHVSPSWLRQKARAGEVPHWKPHAHALLFEADELWAWFERFRGGGDQANDLRPGTLKAAHNGPLRAPVAYRVPSRE